MSKMSNFIIEVDALRDSGYSVQEIADILNTSPDLVKGAFNVNVEYDVQDGIECQYSTTLEIV